MHPNSQTLDFVVFGTRKGKGDETNIYSTQIENFKM
jgi:hypothetical protein